MFNNSTILASLDEQDEHPKKKPRLAVASAYCLPERLPSEAFLLREALREAPRAELRQLRRSPSPPTPSSVPSEELSSPPSPLSTRLRTFSLDGLIKRPAKPPPQTVRQPWRDPQPFEVLRAIEQKDLMFLMEIRDRAFHLLLRRSGDATPLVHAMRMGNTHRDVAIVLVGALSRWVNHLEPEDVQKPQNKKLLKALRVNLKLAIDYGLQQSQSDLIASFLQTLIMSEGERWVWNQISNIALSLNVPGPDGQPVQTAESAVRAFATRELGKADAIAALEDYIANATGDLLMMAAWSNVCENVQSEPIPVSYFARDDRVYNQFVQHLHDDRTAIARTASKRLKWQLRVLEKVLEGRRETSRQKVETLRQEFDGENGI